MSLDDAAIERLVQEAQAGDAWAFGRLFDTITCRSIAMSPAAFAARATRRT